MPLTRRAALAAPALLLTAPASGQGAFPDRPVTLLVPFTAGGPTDVIGRLVADGMSKELGVPVPVENVTGAGGTICAGRVAAARPDGHTIFIHHIGHASTATLYRRLPYDVERSFAPLGLVSNAAMTLIARPDFPATDLAGFMQALRTRGEELNLGHAGLGGANQLCGMLVQAAAGRAATSVVFRGSAPAITELVAGRLDIFCDQATNTAPFIRDNRVRAYAVTTATRVAGLELPTTAEAGQPSIAMSAWHGLYAPANTPEPVVARLSRAIQSALREERLRARFADLLTEPASDAEATPAHHARFLSAEVARLRPLIQAAGQYAD